MALELVSAFYGVDNEDNRRRCMAALHQSIQDFGRIVIPPNFNYFLGFDPLPGKPKTLSITLRHNGAQQTIVVKEGDALVYPINIEVVDAWYGNENLPEQKKQSQPQVLAKVRQLATRTRLEINGSVNQWLGFDPLPGHEKTLYMSLRLDGVPYETRLGENATAIIPATDLACYLFQESVRRDRKEIERLKRQRRDDLENLKHQIKAGIDATFAGSMEGSI